MCNHSEYIHLQPWHANTNSMCFCQVRKRRASRKEALHTSHENKWLITKCATTCHNMSPVTVRTGFVFLRCTGNGHCHSTIITPDYCTASAAYSSATKSEGADSRCPKNANCSMVRQRTDPFQTWGSWTHRRSISQSQYTHQVTGYIWIHILLQPITVFPTIQNACVSLFSYDLYYFCCTPREVSRPQAARASSSSGRDVRFVQWGIPKIS